MDKRTLVDSDFQKGHMLILVLDQSNFPVHSALWLFDEERDSWRLLIASEEVEEHEPMKAYEAIYDVLNKIKKDNTRFDITLDNISLVGLSDNLIKDIGTAVQTGRKSIEGIRFTRHAINNQYIEDAYIYRAQ